MPSERLGRVREAPKMNPPSFTGLLSILKFFKYAEALEEREEISEEIQNSCGYENQPEPKVYGTYNNGTKIFIFIINILLCYANENLKKLSKFKTIRCEM